MELIFNCLSKRVSRTLGGDLMGEKRRVTRLSLKMVLDGEMTKREFEQLCIPEIRKVCSFHGDVYAPEVWVEDLELCTMEILPGKIP